MDCKIVKFGGSSLANAEQIKKAEKIIRSDPSRRIVVVSAPGKRFKDDEKVTDMLYACYDAAVSGGDWETILDSIYTRYDEICRKLDVSVPISEEFEIIRRHVRKQPERDYLASRGEYLSAHVIAEYLGFEFVDAADSICFNDDGSFDWETSNRAVFAALRRAKYAVVPGFYGADAHGRIHTFSRGGSDLTGAIVARALSAELYENWTDVSGMLMADPRVVHAPKTISTITYRELRELAYMGASVMHEDAVFPLRKAGIPMNIRNTNDPGAPGTMIVSTVPAEEPHGSITGIASRNGFSTITIEKAMMNSEIGFGRRVLSVLEELKLSFEHMPSGIDSMSIILSTCELAPYRKDIMNHICHAVCPDSVYIEDGLAMVAVVGRDMVGAKGIAARIIASISKAGINIRMINQGSSEMNIIICVDDEDRENAMRAIYEEFEGERES